MLRLFGFWGLGSFLAVLPVEGAILRVHPSASGAETNGLCWATAFGSVTQALNQASADDELWVAAGTYKGSLQVPSGVALYGGFAGVETSRTERDWERNRSIIDWDQWGDIYPSDYFKPQIAVSLSAASRLDGFTVLNGQYAYGAGVYAGESGAIIANNVIVTNRATGIPNSALLVDGVGRFETEGDFFVRTANDLLRTQFPFAATNIPVNQYSPAVHRLLQVAANVYDATRSNFFPSVFRPRFAPDPNAPGGVIISGYYQDDAAATVDAWLSTNPHGIPMIIGARKGFPNFNELALQTTVLAARRLELRRHSTNSPPHQTNEMYIIGISNFVAVEAWNSYTQAFGHDLHLQISNVCTLAFTANELVQTTGVVAATSSNWTADTWGGFLLPQYPTHPSSLASFKVPLATNTIVLSNSAFHFSPAHLEPLTATSSFEPNTGFQVPEWHLAISNRLTFLLSSAGRIVDFVVLPVTNHTDLTASFFGPFATVGEGDAAECWRTNRVGTDRFTPTAGIQAQLDISLGARGDATVWRDFAFDVVERDSEIAKFRAFCFPFLSPFNSNLVHIAPFSPTRKLQISATYQANDPLVHTMPDHLLDLTNNFTRVLVRPFLNQFSTNHSLARLNNRYSPWRGSPLRTPRPENVDSRIKDPLVWSSDNFDFPSHADVNLYWLDHIHRGTPWQTLYFDQAAAPASIWQKQFLDVMAHPTNDWNVIAYLRGQLAIREPPVPTRILNNTIVGNSADGVFIASNAIATVMNNVVAYNWAGIIAEGGIAPELSRNCVFGNAAHNNGDISAAPQFVPGDFSVVATSPLIDAGNNAALAWIERNTLGVGIDIGAFEFGPDGIPAFVLNSASGTDLELRGFPGQTYALDASTNLLHWSPLTTNIAETGTLLFHDSHATNYPHRFYRARRAESVNRPFSAPDKQLQIP